MIYEEKIDRCFFLFERSGQERARALCFAKHAFIRDITENKITDFSIYSECVRAVKGVDRDKARTARQCKCKVGENVKSNKETMERISRIE